ncbi:MAG: hypothetical protein ACTSRP_01805 [Candidatus Helarchaeota archaeon]
MRIKTNKFKMKKLLGKHFLNQDKDFQIAFHDKKKKRIIMAASFPEEDLKHDLELLKEHLKETENVEIFNLPDFHEILSDLVIGDGYTFFRVKTNKGNALLDIWMTFGGLDGDIRFE